MKSKISIIVAILGAFFVTGVATSNAQATRTWVSGVGDDVNPCSRTAPCKTFAGAISKTAEGGEIDVLDPGGFGTVTITKAMTIDGTHGSGFGSILNSGNIAGIIINVTGGTFVNTAVVTLRGLYFQAASQSPSGTGTSSNGINYLKADRVIVSDCHFENQGNAGIRVSVSTPAALFVRDSEFSNVNTGISVNSTAGTMVVEADNIDVFGSTSGVVLAATNGFGLVTNSNLSRNIGGSAAQAGSGCTLNLTHTHFHANTTAINALAGSTVRVSECELFDNASGFAGNAASIQSGGNNKLAGNAASITPTGPPLTTQ